MTFVDSKFLKGLNARRREAMFEEEIFLIPKLRLSKDDFSPEIVATILSRLIHIANLMITWLNVQHDFGEQFLR